VRQAAAVAADERRALARTLALARQRADALRASPPTAGTFAAALDARPKTVREPLLEHDAIVALATSALGEYRASLAELAVARTAPAAEQPALPRRWYGPDADAALAAFEAYVLGRCRQIATRGPQLGAPAFRALVQRLTEWLGPLAPLEAAAQDRGTIALVLPTPGQDEPPPSANPIAVYEPASDVRVMLPKAYVGELASPNKLYALKLWAGLAPADLIDVPLREDDGPAPQHEPPRSDAPVPPVRSRPRRARSSRRPAPSTPADDGAAG
jgi:hypothetical protein